MRRSRRGWTISLVASLLLLLATGAFAFGGHIFMVPYDSTIPPWLGVGISVLVFVGSQIVFVLPLVKPPRVTSRGRPLLWSMVTAGSVAAILTLLLGMLVMSIVEMATKTYPEDSWGVFSALFFGWWAADWSALNRGAGTKPEIYTFYIEFGVLVVSWIFWSSLLWVFVQRRHKDPGSLVRVTGWLFAGTLIEVLLAIPLMLIVRRRTDCYCATGSFGALVLSVMACLWLCGPGIVIALLWRKRPWTKDHCFRCGYPRKVATTILCSECGEKLSQG